MMMRRRNHKRAVSFCIQGKKDFIYKNLEDHVESDR